MHIYKITNSANGKVYIGQHTGDDLLKYLCSNVKAAGKGSTKKPILFSAIRKYGPSCFTIESLVRIPDYGDSELSKAQLNLLEQFFIRTEDSRNRSIGYNLAIGGEGVNSLSWTPEMREKARQRVLANPVDRSNFVMTDEIRARISAACKGKKMPPNTWSHKVWESRRRNGTACLGYSSKRGTTIPQEVKDKISAAKKGKPNGPRKSPMSEDHKRKISESKKGKSPAWNKGKPWPESMRDKLREAGRKGAAARWEKING